MFCGYLIVVCILYNISKIDLYYMLKTCKCCYQKKEIKEKSDEEKHALVGIV
jgi:hypothetical protein